LIEYLKKIKSQEYEDKDIVNLYKVDSEQIGLWNSEKKIYQKYIQKKDQIIDIGCGTGRTTFNLYDLGYKNIIGLDYSSKMIEECKKINSKKALDIEFITANVCDLKFLQCKYNVCVFSFNGLTTIAGKDNREKAMQQINNVLYEGGLFIFTTHDIYNPLYKEFWRKEKFKWAHGEQDKRLSEFGDIIYISEIEDKKIEGFTHIPSYIEIYSVLRKTNFELIFFSQSEKISIENEQTSKNSGGSIFWIAKKKTKYY